MPPLVRFWFPFARLAGPSPLNRGCGVTAYSRDDGIEILKSTVFVGRTMPHVVSVVENVDISTLDPGHVIPNMAPPDIRGVWYSFSLPSWYSA